MKVIVQKFGGTSLDTDEKRSAAAQHVERARSEGLQTVVVVSAMGRKGSTYATDTLLSLVDTRHVPKEAADALMACGEVISAVKFASVLGERGIETLVLNGRQAGIVTDDNFGDANVLFVDTTRIQLALQAKKVVIVTGFQGATQLGDVTTLGRGGSDTTAVVLGAALAAESVEIFTDVDGVMTADPRIVPSARLLRELSYGEMYSMAVNGAKVLHPTAVRAAEEQGIAIHVRNTMSTSPGTIISDEYAKDAAGFEVY